VKLILSGLDKREPHSEFLLSSSLSSAIFYFAPFLWFLILRTWEAKREGNGLCRLGDGSLDARGSGRVRERPFLKEGLQQWKRGLNEACR
jgi:hypothetical protein